MHRRHPRAPRGAAVLAGLVLAVGLCSVAAPAAAQGRIVVGSKNFTESHLLGEMITLLIRERTNLEVEHRSGLGGTLVCWTALKRGEIDIYPEYTGTGWAIILKEPGHVSRPLRAFLYVQQQFAKRYDVTWLEPFGLNNTYAIAVREALADSLGLRTISDLAAHAADLRAGFSIEFMNREDGWPGLSKFYGFKFGRLRALEHGLAYEAINAHDIDVIDAYSTDGKLMRYPLRVLADDRGFFPPYNAAPIVRGATLRAHPELRDVLQSLAFQIPDSTMIRLNYAVEEQGRGFHEVARDFLIQKGLLEKHAETEQTHTGPTLGQFVISRLHPTLVLGIQHLQLSLLAVLLAILFAVPVGIAIIYSPLGERLALGSASVIQTIPSLALLAFMIAIPGLGLSVRSAVTALFLYALLPILRNTVTGLRNVDAEMIDAATGIGLSRRQILMRVRLPLATSTIMAGVRTSTVISIGVATLAAFIGAGGLGEPIVTGLYLNDTRLILAGAIPAALLALLADWLLGILEHRLVPRGLRVRSRNSG